MLPYILAAVGGYLIGQSQKKDVPQMAKGGILEIKKYISENYPDKDLNDEEFISLLYSVFSTKIERLGLSRNDLKDMLHKKDDGGMMAKGGKLDSVIDNIVSNVLKQIDKAEDSAEDFQYLLNGVIRKLQKFSKKAEGGMMKKGGKLDSVIDDIVSNVLKQIDKAEDSAEDFQYLLNGVIRKLQKFSKKAEGGMMAKGGKIPEKEVESLKRYTLKWYGKDGIDDDDDADFRPPVTQKEVEDAVSEYVRFCKKAMSEGNESKWGGGDSFDREVVADIMQYNRNPEADTFFYPELIKEIKNIDGKMPMMYAKGGEIKVGDTLTASTGVKVRVVEYDPKFGGRVKVERLDEYATGKPSQFMPLSKFKMEYGGMMAKGGKIPEKEVESLKRYTLKWYGKDGIDDDDDADFKPPVTQKEVEDAVSEYVRFCKKAISEGNESKWGGGDSFDREVVADIMQYNRNPEADTFFYPELIKEIKNIDGKMPMMYAKGGKVKSKKWIQDALGGDEGSLRRTAKRKGLLKGDENLSMTDLKKLQKMGGKTAKRAHLAETLRKFDDGGMTDYYEDLRVYVQGVGTIYKGNSLSEATDVFDEYYANNPHAEMVMVDEKYGDEIKWANTSSTDDNDD